MPLFYHYADREALPGILRDGITYGGAVMRDAPDGRKRIGLTRYRGPCHYGFYELPWPEAQELERTYWEVQRVLCEKINPNGDFEEAKHQTIELNRDELFSPVGVIRIAVELAEDDPKLSIGSNPSDMHPEMWMAHLGTIPPSAIKEILDVETGAVLWPTIQAP